MICKIAGRTGLPRTGTNAGYQAHKSAGEVACAKCLQAECDRVTPKLKIHKVQTKHLRDKTALQIKELLLANCDWDGTCDVWTGRLTPQGYGMMPVRGLSEAFDCIRPSVSRSVHVHRVMYVACYGPVLPTEVVHHTCGRGAAGCTSPDHLQAVGGINNLAEMRERKYYLDTIKSQQLEIETLRGLLNRKG